MSLFSAEYATQLDQEDPLGRFREKFHIPLAKNAAEDSEVTDDRLAIYFNGNSLGCQPKSTKENVLAVLDNWQVKLGFEIK